MRAHVKNPLGWLLFLVIGLHTAQAQDATSSFDPGLAVDLEEALVTEFQRWQIPGVSAAVIVEGQGLWSGVVGLPFWEAGTAYCYSNSNYLIMGMVIEAAARQLRSILVAFNAK